MAGIGAPKHDDVIVRAARAFLNGVPINNKHTFFFEGHVEVNKRSCTPPPEKLTHAYPKVLFVKKWLKTAQKFWRN